MAVRPADEFSSVEDTLGSADDNHEQRHVAAQDCMNIIDRTALTSLSPNRGALHHQGDQAASQITEQFANESAVLVEKKPSISRNKIHSTHSLVIEDFNSSAAGGRSEVNKLAYTEGAHLMGYGVNQRSYEHKTI